jgi:hypothetical protein
MDIIERLMQCLCSSLYEVKSDANEFYVPVADREASIQNIHVSDVKYTRLTAHASRVGVSRVCGFRK